MLVTHSIDDRRIGKNVDNEVGFLLTNRKGGFLNLGISSKYRGLFFSFRDEVLKLIDDIRIKGLTKELRNNFWNIERISDSNRESFFMPFGTESLVYELEKKDDIELLFDVKYPYDNRVWGRNYSLCEESGKVIVEFTKTTDSREDSTHNEREFTVFMAILPAQNSEIAVLNEWENRFYIQDKKRNTYPVERFVYKGVRISSTRLIISFSESREEAVKICDKISEHLSKYNALQKKYSAVSIKDIKDNKINMAVKCALESLDSLLVKTNEKTNLYAGLPWFFQFWSRDTLISLNALMLDREYDTVKKILMDLTANISDDGLLPNRIPQSVTKSADSIGWLFKRWDDFIESLRKARLLTKYFKKSEIDFITDKLEDSMDRMFRGCTIDSLARNNNQETWMDTIFEQDGRKGARIEIQALRLFMYNFLYKLTDKSIYKDMRDKLHAKVKEVFWTGKYLKDGHDDGTIRPNLFIAAYIYPDLLTEQEWINCFDNVLPKLWLEWGGLSTIDTEHPDFHSHHTGEDSRSYHRGDSWYWINNLSALVLYRLDKNHFKKYIDKIIEAGCEDILFDGFIGCHSELSSASCRSAQGCLNQAWSNALFVELIEEINS